MLRASCKDPPLIICGLADGNIMRLKAGQSIKATFRSFGLDTPGELVIFHGPTEADMECRLREQGLIGEDTEQYRDPLVAQEAEIRSRYPHVLIATVGLPRSGKTTWATKQAYPVVNPDSIRLALHGQRYVERAEPFVWAAAKLMVRALFLAGHSIVLLDATNTTRKRRDEWRSADWGLFFKVIATSAAVCLGRADAVDDKEIIPVIHRMAEAFEPLQEDELRWP